MERQGRKETFDVFKNLGESGFMIETGGPAEQIDTFNPNKKLITRGGESLAKDRQDKDAELTKLLSEGGSKEKIKELQAQLKKTQGITTLETEGGSTVYNELIKMGDGYAGNAEKINETISQSFNKATGEIDVKELSQKFEKEFGMKKQDAQEQAGKITEGLSSKNRKNHSNS